MYSHLRSFSVVDDYDFSEAKMSMHDVPSELQLDEAKANLALQELDAQEIERKIAVARANLELIITESNLAIRALEDEQEEAALSIRKTKAFLSPMRRLPDDILQLLFWFQFDASPTCAWTLAAVCRRWRRMLLNMPRIWSKVRSVGYCPSSRTKI